MQGETVARNYASALFEIAERSGEMESYGEALDLVAGLLEDERDFRLFLETPRVELAEKKKVLRTTFESRLPAHVMNFLLLVVDKRRQGLFGGIARQYRALLDEKLGRAHVEVTLARPVDEAFAEGLKQKLSRVLEKDVVPHIRVKPELLGGIVFRTGDIVFDGSVRRRLEDMRRRMLAADISTN